MPSPALSDRICRLIVDAMDEGVATISPAGVILGVNPCLCSMTGRTAVELVGAAVLDLIPAPGRPTFARMLDIDVGGGARGEIDLSGPGGVIVPVLLAVSGFDLDGMFLRSLVLTDLTAQRAADALAAEAHEAPPQQHAFLERAQQTLGLGWWTYDPAREKMLTFSPAACEVFGLIPAEFDGKLESLSSLVHPDDLPWINEAYKAALEGGTPYQVEHRIVWPDGSLRWVLMAAVVQGDHAGGSKRMLGICQDITDRKRIQDEVRAAALYNRSLIEASLNPMVTIGPDGTITDVNIATEQVTGYARADSEPNSAATSPNRTRPGPATSRPSGMAARGTTRWNCATATGTSHRCCTTPRSTATRPGRYSGSWPQPATSRRSGGRQRPCASLKRSSATYSTTPRSAWAWWH